MHAIQGTVLTVGWVIVWFLVLAGGVWQLVRGRSGAGACLGGAAILGLGVYLCGGGVAGTVTAPLGALAGPRVVQGLGALLIGCADAVVLLLLVLGVSIQRPTPAK
jgi:hypothetical protein